MSDLGWFVLIAVSAVSLASMAVRAIPRQERKDAAVYVAVLALASLSGALIAASFAADHIALGAVVGLGCVELGPSLGRLVPAAFRALVGRIKGGGK